MWLLIHAGIKGVTGVLLVSMIICRLFCAYSTGKLLSTTYTHETMINPLNNALVLPFIFGQGSRWVGWSYADLYDADYFTQIIVLMMSTIRWLMGALKDRCHPTQTDDGTESV